MNLSDALNNLEPIYGATSVIAATLANDGKSVKSIKAGIETTLEAANKQLSDATTAQVNCYSDAAWWGIESAKAYWSTVINLLEASKLSPTGELPDIPFKRKEGQELMDALGSQRAWGDKVYATAVALCDAQQEQEVEQKTEKPETVSDARQLIGIAIGRASMCWEHPDKAGVFLSHEAAKIIDDLMIELELGLAPPTTEETKT